MLSHSSSLQWSNAAFVANFQDAYTVALLASNSAISTAFSNVDFVENSDDIRKLFSAVVADYACYFPSTVARAPTQAELNDVRICKIAGNGAGRPALKTLVNAAMRGARSLQSGGECFDTATGGYTAAASSCQLSVKAIVTPTWRSNLGLSVEDALSNVQALFTATLPTGTTIIASGVERVYNDDDDLSSGAIAGIVVGCCVFVIVVVILILYCCGCCCFGGGEAESATAKEGDAEESGDKEEEPREEAKEGTGPY